MAITINGSGTVTGLSAGGLGASVVNSSNIVDATIVPGDMAQPLTSGTTQATTSGTSIDFTSIPSWVKRITLSMNGVSLSGTANFLIQSGSGSIENTGYTSQCALALASGGATQGSSSTAGFVFQNGNASNAFSGQVVLTLIGSNVWICSGVIASTTPPGTVTSAGTKTFSGTIDRLRLTTTNGTDTFDAGSANILYE